MTWEIGGRRDLIAAWAILALWAAILAVKYHGLWAIDMSAIYMAGRFAWAGDWAMAYGAPPDFFSRQVPQEWTALLAGFGLAEKFATPFVYPPIWALLVAPFAGATDPIAFFDVARPLMLGCYAGAVMLAWRLMRPRGMPAALFAALAALIASVTVPFQFAADLVQPQLLVVFLILLSFERYAAGRDRTAGAVLGIVAALKLSPVLLCLIFAADRRWRAVAACLATAGGVALASLALTGWEVHATYLDRLRQVDALLPLHGLNLTFETAMHDLFLPVPLHEATTNPLLGRDTAWVSELSRLLLLAALPAILWVTRRLPAHPRLQLRLPLVYLAVAFFSPLAWMHYYTLPLLLAPGLLGLWSPRRTALATLALAAGFSTPVMEGALDWSLAHGDFSAILPQLTALPSLAVFTALLVAHAARHGAPRRGAATGEMPSPG